MGKKTLSPSRMPEETQKRQQPSSSLSLGSLHTRSQPKETPRSAHEIFERVRENSLVRLHAEEVRRLAGVIYGDASVLNLKIEEITRYPELKGSIVRIMIQNPASIHPFAGKEVCGLKTSARRRAESKFPELCDAFDNLTQAVIYTYGNMGVTLPKENPSVEEHLKRSSEGKVKTPLSKEQVDRLRNDTFVRDYRARVTNWSEIVYGNSQVFQKQMEAVLKDPAGKEKILWGIAACPESFHKFAGYNICGIKSGARIRAENRLTHLYDAFASYIYAVKDAREIILQEQQILQQQPQQGRFGPSRSQSREITQQKTQEQQHMQASKSAVTTAQATVSPSKAPLSNAEVIAAVRNDDNVRRHNRRIKYWSNSVFGRENVLQQHMENILTSPETAEQLLQDLTTNPASFHKLAGHSICGFRSRARRNAEDCQQHLQHAVRAYICAVREAREDITQAQGVQQQCLGASESQKQEITQKIQKPQERQQTQYQRGKTGMAFAL
ncbi:BID domain-containing T4SS effector [Bartonella phoceensis]|uniref:BID domain-containing T4SS effector n=1 Tax=Bartonella phoceensis TaxID=270249 RepID=UPI001ABB599C|nr:BID domain-containing T4SS effector [Bartonella phoceensis]